LSKRIEKPERLSRQELSTKLSELLPQFQQESERGSALLAGALLDDVLAERLKDFFVADPNAVKAMMGVERPLGTFGARIQMGYLLGFFGPETRKALEIIKDVRNSFAHYHQLAHYTDPEVSRVCLTLLPGWIEAVMDGQDHPTCKEPRRRFQAAVAFLIVRLLQTEPARKAPKSGDDYFVLG